MPILINELSYNKRIGYIGSFLGGPIYIKNPNNLQIKNYLDEKYQNINYNNAQNNSQINMQNNMQNASQNNMQNNSQYNTQINQQNNYPNNYQYNFTRANRENRRSILEIKA